jgi:predicted transposase YbfD/YdcC
MPSKPLFTTHFLTITDPRIDRQKAHLLIDIIMVAICAVICGADNWIDIADFGEAKEQWLKTFLALPNGIPSRCSTQLSSRPALLAGYNLW